jgi:hypothetical protein
VIIANNNIEADRNQLIGILERLRPTPRFQPIPKLKVLRALPEAWRALSLLGRLKIIAEFDEDTKTLKLGEIRLAQASIGDVSWDDTEDALSINLHQYTITQKSFSAINGTIAGCGLHSLARRYERGAVRTDEAVLRDLQALALNISDAVKQGGDFNIDVSGGGKFVGQIVDEQYGLVRTFLGPRM